MTINSDPNDNEFWAFRCRKATEGRDQHIEPLFRNQASNSQNKPIGGNG
jgi:hypothetical protein